MICFITINPFPVSEEVSRVSGGRLLVAETGFVFFLRVVHFNKWQERQEVGKSRLKACANRGDAYFFRDTT